MAEPRRVRAYIGLGANLGDAATTLAAGVHAIGALPGVRLRGVSRLFATEPWGVTDQPEFRNAVVALDVPAGPSPEVGASALLVALKSIERAFGRQEREHWGPRELDLDLLVFGRARISIERPPAGRSTDPAKADLPLTVPHPEAGNRLFVLAPLADLARDLVPPGWTETVETARDRQLVTEGPSSVRSVARWDHVAGSWVALEAYAAEPPAGRLGLAPALRFGSALGVLLWGAAACLVTLWMYARVLETHGLDREFAFFGIIPLAASAFAVREGFRIVVRASDPVAFRTEASLALVATVTTVSIRTSPSATTLVVLVVALVCCLLVVAYRRSRLAADDHVVRPWRFDVATDVRMQLAGASLAAGYGAALIVAASLQVRRSIRDYFPSQPSGLQSELVGAIGIVLVAGWFLFLASRRLAVEDRRVVALVAVGALVAAIGCLALVGMPWDPPVALPVLATVVVVTWLAATRAANNRRRQA